MAAKLAGGGGSRYDLGQNSEINVTPFVDILLVLLIIFMVAIPMATVSIKLDLPPPSPYPPETQREPLFISVLKNGDIMLGQTKSALNTIVTDLRTQNMTANDVIMIRADADVQYERFMTVLNELQGNGFQKIGLISEDLSLF